MKQLALGYLQYSQDNDSRLPCGFAKSGAGWGEQLYPYIKSTAPYKCPFDDTTTVIGKNIFVPVSYGFNSNLRSRRVADADQPAKSVVLFETTGTVADLTSIPRISKGIYLSPAGNGLDGQLYCDTLNHTHPAKYAIGNNARSRLNPTQLGADRHGKGACYAMLDGHVKWLYPSLVSTGTNARHSNDPQTGNVTGTAAGASVPRYISTFSIR